MANYFQNGTQGRRREVTIVHEFARSVTLKEGDQTLGTLYLDDPVEFALGILGEQPAAKLAQNPKMVQYAKLVLLGSEVEKK